MNCEIPNKRKCCDFGKTSTFENQIFSPSTFDISLITGSQMTGLTGRLLRHVMFYRDGACVYQWYKNSRTVTMESHVADT